MRILITGTSRGIGKILADELLKSGHEVIGLSRSSSTIDNNNYTHLVADLANVDSIKVAIRGLDCVDVVINSAAMASLNAFLLSEVEDLEKIFKTNVFGPYFLIRELTKEMMLKRNGRVINLSTVATVLNIAGELQYAMSKAAMEKFTHIVAKELAPYGVTVNTVRISLFDTELLKGVTEDKIKKIQSQMPLPRYVEKEDLLHVVNFFMSDRAGAITGQTISFGGLP